MQSIGPEIYPWIWMDIIKRKWMLWRGKWRLYMFKIRIWAKCV